MHKYIFLNRTATLAITATVALSNSPLLAQDPPVAETSAETATTAEPAAAEPATDSVSTDPNAGQSAEAAPVASAPTPAPRARPKATASAPAAKAAPARAETAAAVPEPSPLQAQPLLPPLSEPIAEPTAATVEPAMAAPNGDLERAAFAGILALLALSGAATAVSRRRQVHRAPDRPFIHDAARASPPHQMPAGREPIRPAPSAFAWGQSAPVAPVVNSGGAWVERARRGPSPDNPSLSLKKRMKRAAFYEQRERAVAAGRAKPLVSQAGLPQRATENFRQGWNPQPASTRAYQPA